MNYGKICVSVCAKTVDELFAQIRRAETLADVIEIRFDCLIPTEIKPVAENLPKINGQYLITFRPKAQGGNREITIGERLKFWEYILWQLKGTDFLVDYEFDIDFPLKLDRNRTIVSMHDFRGVPRDLPMSYDVLSNLTGAILKIAAHADDITDSIDIWKLLEQSRLDKRQIIPIAMGEAGKWTRILGPAHGAFMTYASLGAGSETAPGQISAADMIDVFRVKELDENTAVYGIVAGDTSYSVSPYMHNAAFKAKEINSVFVPLQTADVGVFLQRMVKSETREIDLNFKGFSVTNPHKQSIIKHLDIVDETAQKIGAVNTVKIDAGKFYGYNTDAPGFIAPLKKVFGDLKNANVAVIGAGGASRACIYALLREGSTVTLFARDPRKAQTLADEFGIVSCQLTTDNRPLSTVFDIIVNATPLGTRGVRENETVLTAEQLKGVKLVYDLIYNPAETRLMKEARSAGAKTIGGIEMLIAQGAKQFEIWTGQQAPIDEMAAAVKKRLNL